MSGFLPPPCTAPEPLRRCRSCAELLPLADFRRRARDTDQRFRQCRVCHAAAMRRYRSSRSARDRQSALSGHFQRLRTARTHAARLRVVDEIAAAFSRSGSVGDTFHGLLSEARRRGNHRQQLRLISDFMLVLSTAASCSTQAAETVNGTVESINQAAGTA